MDLVSGTRRIIVAMEHTTRSGKPRVMKECTDPLTGRGVVNMIITSLAVMEVTPEGLLLKEVAPSFTPEEVQAVTESNLIIAKDLHEMNL